jgi:hypothetical protein
MYAELDPVRIVETSERLQHRIEERFPGSGLSRVAGELSDVARSAASVGDWLARPIRPVRILVTLGIAALAAVVLLALEARTIDFSNTPFSDAVQGVEALINDCIFVGIAVYFMLGIEQRVKRKRALGQLRVLRSFAHIVDMHQLTKDPERLDNRGGDDTASSPKREMSPFLLTRYLDYSSELLAVISMIAAIYVQRFDDAETMNAASAIEELTVGLSRKIWQKISILDRDLQSAYLNVHSEHGT